VVPEVMGGSRERQWLGHQSLKGQCACKLTGFTQPWWMEIWQENKQQSEFEQGSQWWKVAGGPPEYVTVWQGWGCWGYGGAWKSEGAKSGTGMRDASPSCVIAGFLIRGQTSFSDSQASINFGRKRGEGMRCLPPRHAKGESEKGRPSSVVQEKSTSIVIPN
jgi:hypothetical protein